MKKYNFDLLCRLDEQGGMTALMMAASNGHHRCASTLIANGADVNFATKVNKHILVAFYVSMNEWCDVPL